jgi:hypothetical protein
MEYLLINLQKAFQQEFLIEETHVLQYIEDPIQAATNALSVLAQVEDKIHQDQIRCYYHLGFAIQQLETFYQPHVALAVKRAQKIKQDLNINQYQYLVARRIYFIFRDHYFAIDKLRQVQPWHFHHINEKNFSIMKEELDHQFAPTLDWPEGDWLDEEFEYDDGASYQEEYEIQD